MQSKKSIALMAMGIGLSITPPVLLMYGLSQFKISFLVGAAAATSWFGYCVAIVSALMVGLGPGSGWLADRLYRRIGSRRRCMGLLAPTLILWGTHWGADGYGFFFILLAGVALLGSLFIACVPASRCEAPD